VYIALILAAFFTIGMIPIDTLDSIVLRSAFGRIFNTNAFRYMAYALSGAAMSTVAIGSYSVITGRDILPPLTGPILAIVIISSAFGYAFIRQNKGQRLSVHSRDIINS
jgi:nickel/cobalt transporter (NiCoT) family protein